ncbi:MAG: tyrosine--tRNA ligase [Thermoprotei archaeon]|nr:MAG: tyrosine--tRNA ligase [Thermoprotei archaeon]
MYNLIEELTWRGMLHDTIPGTDELLKTEAPVRGYIGFDPTADSLHIGNLATIMLLVHFQRAGHKPFMLVGGGTGMIGDPSGKSDERKLLTEEQIRHNEKGIRNQLSHFLDFSDSPTGAVMVNNFDWISQINMIDFLRDIGKHLTVNYMLAKDSVKTRIESGISFTEFSYQLLQGYDFYFLFRTHNVKMQLGGSDQWGNITTGTELIRRTGSGNAFALTTPLVTKSDGTKFGKSEGGNIWLDSEKTSPYQFYQFWVNVADDDIERFTKVFSLKTRNEIEQLMEQQKEAAHLRPMQYALAEELTERIHGSAALTQAKKASTLLFGKSTVDDLAAIDEKTLLQVFDTIPKITINKKDVDANLPVVELLTTLCDTTIFASKGEMRRLVKQNGLSINKVKVADSDAPLSTPLLHNKYLLVQKGKKHYFLLQFA